MNILKIIGTAPNQIPVNGMLGDLAFRSVKGLLEDDKVREESTWSSKKISEHFTEVTPFYTETSVNKTLSPMERCTVLVSGLTITLPSNPIEGTECWISVGEFTDTVVDPNGSSIMSLADTRIINRKSATVGFYYSSGTWRAF